MKNLSSLSVFFPAFNEERNIETVVKKALAVLPNIADSFEVIVVNDGSKDNTREVVEKMAAENSKVKLVSHPVNKGYGAALKTGFKSAKNDYIVFNDGDGQFDFSEASDFASKIDMADVVIGYRIKRNDPFFRLVNAKLYALFLFILFGLKVKDIDCGFKMIKRKVVETLPPLKSDGALISAELLIRIKKAGYKIIETPVSHYPRIAGLPTGANIGVIFKMFREVIRLYNTLR